MEEGKAIMSAQQQLEQAIEEALAVLAGPGYDGSTAAATTNRPRFTVIQGGRA